MCLPARVCLRARVCEGSTRKYSIAKCATIHDGTKTPMFSRCFEAFESRSRRQIACVVVVVVVVCVCVCLQSSFLHEKAVFNVRFF